jgi:hypothetical protein
MLGPPGDIYTYNYKIVQFSRMERGYFEAQQSFTCK